MTDKETQPTAEDEVAAATKRTVGMVPLAVVAVVALVAGLAIGMLTNCSASAPSTSAKLQESQLDSVVASYTYKGTSHDVTARQAIESQYGVDSMRDTDGTYTAPSTETILSYVRNEIICEDAAAQGVSVSEDDLAAYAKSTLGTDDMESIASLYGVSTDQAHQIVLTSATVNKLNEKITDGAATMPSPPREELTGEEYGDYIANLLGAEWNRTADKWASEDGPLYESLKDTEITTTEEATYDQALTVYQVVYASYSSNANNERQAWSNYLNDLFANASIECYGLYL